MAAIPSQPRVVKFGIFEVDLQAGEVRKAGMRQKLAGQPFQVLQALLQHPQEIVTREELRERIWPGNAFVDYELALKKAVNRLRELLGDSAESPHFIETVPRRGYRFIGTITPPLSLPADSGEHIVGAVETGGRPIHEPRSKTWKPWKLLGGLALACVAAVLLWSNADKLRTRIFARSRPAEIHSVAVLPLENLSKDPEQEYFVDGMTDELITDLAKVGQLQIISHTSVERYKGTKLPLPKIAQELGVDAVVEGRVLRSGDRVRITAQLIDARTDRHLWAESYERYSTDVLSLQDEVARDIATKIRGRLTPQDQARLARVRPIDPVTNEDYLKGRYYYGKLSVEGFKEGLKYYQQAVARDANYAPAYVGIAASYEGLGVWEQLPPREAALQAKAALEKALALDDTLGEAHAILGHIHFLWDWDWVAAEQEYKRALELGPPSSMIQIRYAIYLSSMGRQNEALQEMRAAHVLDPVSHVSNDILGFVYYLAHDFDRAIDQYQKTLALYPDSGNVHLYLGRCYEQKAMYPEAFQEYQRMESLEGATAAELTTRRQAFAKSGMRGYWQIELEGAIRESKRPYFSSDYIAELYVNLGKKDHAIEFLEKAYQARSHDMAFILVEPRFNSLHSDPRFQDLLRRMNFPMGSTSRSTNNY
jgi:TolB-like protein/DNA-binding winged helix-turn-helix (wHTH) protein/Tfp pilus assembly protein PilF